MAKVGRRAKLTGEKYLEAVKKVRSLNDADIANSLGVDLTTVYRFRNKEENKSVVADAEKALSEIEIVRYDGDNNSMDVFLLHPSIKTWIEKQQIKRVSNDTLTSRLNALYNVCKHLGVNPDKLTLDACSKLVIEMRTLDEQKKEHPSGLAYLYIRKPIRMWFMLMKGIAGEYLTGLGISADATKGTGSMATERVTKKQRALFWDNVPNAVMKYCKDETITINEAIDEIRHIGVFMYYTGTRIRASRNTRFDNPKNKYDEDIWIINLIDKGKRGGIEWNKRLYGDGLDKMREYVERRFGISKETQDKVLPTFNSYIFPWIQENSREERNIMKDALKESGVKTTIPNHIWRHTFAQDMLEATDWNYELVAAIGGWTDTSTMKKSYGKINDKALQRGLRKAMGYKVEDVTYELRW